MSGEKPTKLSGKQKVAREFEEFMAMFLYFAFFFCAIATYSMLLLNKFQISYFNYGAALINALVIAKVILIGEYVQLGKKHEAQPLLVSTLYKAFLFGLLVFGFHIVEEIIKRLLRGEHIAGAFHDMRIDDILARSVIIFCTFIPLFAFRELSRVLGKDKFRSLLFRSRADANPAFAEE
jgi:hypothetical protein